MVRPHWWETDRWQAYEAIANETARAVASGQLDVGPAPEPRRFDPAWLRDFVNRARQALGKPPLGQLHCRGTDPRDSTSCLLALAIGCVVDGTYLNFDTTEEARAVARATGIGPAEENAIALPPALIRLVHLFDDGAITDADLLGPPYEQFSLEQSPVAQAEDVPGDACRRDQRRPLALAAR